MAQGENAGVQFLHFLDGTNSKFWRGLDVAWEVKLNGISIRLLQIPPCIGNLGFVFSP